MDLLHQETKMLPVQDHFSLIFSQYPAKTLQPNNPSNNIYPDLPVGNKTHEKNSQIS